jgi:hypothetical protein
VLIGGGLRFWRPSKPKVRLAEFKSRHVSAGRILWRPNIWNRTLLVPLDVGFTTTQLPVEGTEHYLNRQHELAGGVLNLMKSHRPLRDSLESGTRAR